MCPGEDELTRSPGFSELLTRSRNGNKQALDELVPLVYTQLHALAARLIRAERPDHTLRPTALINEAYVRLAEGEVGWLERAHFLALAARLMRQVLIDYARSRRAVKRGGTAIKLPLDEAIAIVPDRLGDILVMDEALNRLAQADARKSQVIELLYFGGLSYSEAAGVLGISEATLHRDLAFARSWLHRELALSEGQT
jgi:RNA polymerase sigma-70 factor (ECF subfamily)